MPATGEIYVKRITDGRRIVLLLSRITNVQNQSRAGIDRRRRRHHSTSHAIMNKKGGKYKSAAVYKGGNKAL